MTAPAMLASVRTPEEAQLVLDAGADLIDAKEPRTGALGALPPTVIRAIVAAVAGRRPVSATAGDLPIDSPALCPTARAVAACGVDYVKIGLFGPVDAAVLRAALAELPARLPGPPGTAGARRIAVLLADQGGDQWSLPLLAELGFAGVMLDTGDKRCGGLRAVMSTARLADFVARARAAGLLSGLAGSLQLADVPVLAALQPDYLGFRGALCAAGVRAGALDAAACVAVRRQVASGAQAIRAADDQPA